MSSSVKTQVLEYFLPGRTAQDVIGASAEDKRSAEMSISSRDVTVAVDIYRLIEIR